MPTMLYVMLIWGGSVHAAPATIQPFTSLKTCEFNRPLVELGFKSLNVDRNGKPNVPVDSSGHPYPTIKTVCIALVNKLD